MLKTFLVLAAGAVSLAACSQSTTSSSGISGAGATFPAPVYGKWAEAYKAQTNAALNYQAIGSGGGIKQIEAGTVDFGASDKPLKPDVLAANGLVQFPTVVGGVVPVVDIPGVDAGALRLTGAVLANIYRGVEVYWDDKDITALNPSLKLPHTKITVVHRSDGSGTSFLFTSYLAMSQADWQAKVGANDAVSWPVGIGGKGNDGVAAMVKQTPGSIGYVEYAYAMQNHMAYTLMQNKSGAWVAPTAENFAAAAASADWSKAPGFYLLLLDQPGANAWPITGATFILLHAKAAKPEASRAVLSFFDWAYKNGDATANSLDYVPLPDSVKTQVRASWSQVVGPDGQPVFK